jgi:cyclopropane fatty-acyl-phospholipid synthase-like methyltransferase
MAELRAGQTVLDVGCGMGGTSIDLARRFGCTVTGVTLSPVQRAWASCSARWQGAHRKARFLCRDAERMSFPPRSFDAVWSVESTEHLFDKPAFFRKAAGWLEPGGRLVIAAWLAAGDPRAAKEALTVAEAFLCPSFGTAADYRDWCHDAGLVNRAFHEVTAQVAATWDICRQRVQKSGVGLFAWLAGRRMREFLNHFQTLGNAYRSGAMQYGLFLAEKIGS